MRLLKAILLSVIILTVLVFPIEKNALSKPVSTVVLMEQGMILPSTGTATLSANAGEGTNYTVGLFDPERRRALLEKNVSGNFRWRLRLDHSGPYQFSVRTMTPVTLAVRVVGRHPSVRVLNLRYGTGGVSALLLALILLVEARRK